MELEFPSGLAHLIRDTSIISSSNPHELTVQGKREAAPAVVHRVQALCWPRGLLARPKGCSLTGVIVRSSLSCWLPHPHPSVPTQAPAAKQNAPQAPHPRHQGGGSRGRSRRALRCLPGTDARSSLARSQMAFPRGASLTPEKAQPWDDPTQGWRASQRWQKRFA